MGNNDVISSTAFSWERPDSQTFLGPPQKYLRTCHSTSFPEWNYLWGLLFWSTELKYYTVITKCLDFNLWGFLFFILVLKYFYIPLLTANDLQHYKGLAVFAFDLPNWLSSSFSKNHSSSSTSPNETRPLYPAQSGPKPLVLPHQLNDSRLGWYLSRHTASTSLAVSQTSFISWCGVHGLL